MRSSENIESNVGHYSAVCLDLYVSIVRFGLCLGLCLHIVAIYHCSVSIMKNVIGYNDIYTLALTITPCNFFLALT